jgi:hypothetical protein
MIHMGDDGDMNQVPTELWLTLATRGMADLFEFDEFLFLFTLTRYSVEGTSLRASEAESQTQRKRGRLKGDRAT